MNENGEILFRDIYHLVTMNDRDDRFSGVDLLVRGRRVAVCTGPGILAGAGLLRVDLPRRRGSGLFRHGKDALRSA